MPPRKKAIIGQARWEFAGFDSRIARHWIAQLVEQSTNHRCVAGSTPAPKLSFHDRVSKAIPAGCELRKHSPPAWSAAEPHPRQGRLQLVAHGVTLLHSIVQDETKCAPGLQDASPLVPDNWPAGLAQTGNIQKRKYLC